jgi:hypothetical protein
MKHADLHGVSSPCFLSTISRLFPGTTFFASLKPPAPAHGAGLGPPAFHALPGDIIENFFGNLKQFKRIVMRSGKTDQSFSAITHLTAAVMHSR